MTDTENRLIALAAKRFGKNAEALEPDDDFFQSLAIDSYQAMDLLTQLEETFDVEIPDYELHGVTTFSGLASVIERRL